MDFIYGCCFLKDKSPGRLELKERLPCPYCEHDKKGIAVIRQPLLRRTGGAQLFCAASFQLTRTCLTFMNSINVRDGKSCSDLKRKEAND
jgi:hypothetical protein